MKKIKCFLNEYNIKRIEIERKKIIKILFVNKIYQDLYFKCMIIFLF